MALWKIGVVIELFQRDIRQGIEQAAELGADGFELSCTSGPIEPEKLSTEKRLEFADFVRDQGLMISALRADLGGRLFQTETSEDGIAQCKACINLAADLGSHVVTSHLGRLPDDGYSETWRVGVPAVRDVADYAAARGVRLACKTGSEAPEVLERFLVKVGSPGLRIAYDPADLLLGGYDPLNSLDLFGDAIVHAYAKDCVCRGDDSSVDISLGDGEVDFPRYLDKLNQAGYRGFLSIGCRVGADPVAAVASAVEFLRRF